MSAINLIVGLGLLALVLVDLLWTTLWAEGGAGPLTSLLMDSEWRLLRTVGSGESRIQTLAGPLILVLSLITWILLLWAGWTLLFASTTGPIADTVSGRQVAWPDLIYFTGYTIFTLGIGDFIPQGSLWQLLTAIMAGSGMLFITLIVTYVLSVLGAVTQKRSFASSVSGLGASSTQILKTSWEGTQFRGIELPLNTIAAELNTLTSNHKAYPILHYFYTENAEEAPTTSLVIFDEALTLLRYGVQERDRPSDLIVAESRESVQRYLETVSSAYIEPSDTQPPSPGLSELTTAGIPTVSEKEFRSSMRELDERRRTLLALIESDARQWPN